MRPAAARSRRIGAMRGRSVRRARSGPTARRTAAPMRPAAGGRRSRSGRLGRQPYQIYFPRAGVGAPRRLPRGERQRRHLQQARTSAGIPRAHAGPPRAVADGDRGTDRAARHARQEFTQVVRADADAPRLCTVPGIGPITALTFVAVVDDVGASAAPRRCAPTWDSCPVSGLGAAPAWRITRPAMRGCGRCSSRNRLEHPAL
jgi:hypothetical protein